MKLKQFKERDNKRIGIIVFTISCVLLIAGVFFFRSFALFEEKKNFNVINGTVTDPGDLYFAYYVEDVITFDLPLKSSGYTLASKSSCNNGVTVSWDYDNWSALVNYANYQKGNSSKTKCNLYFEPTASKYIETLASTSEEIVDDETADHNLRYIGKDPNNYVSFNNELWRIIGVMNNVDDGSGKKESRIKLIRNDSIGNFSWDTSISTINKGYGINEWSTSDVMKILNPNFEANKDFDNSNHEIVVNNSLYWNRTKGNCYSDKENVYISCDFAEIGLIPSSKGLVGKTLWNIGTNDRNLLDYSILTSKFYELERSENTGKICISGEYCNDDVERTSSWIGYIGLISPSDYGYATSGGINTNKNTCLTTHLYNWATMEECKTNNWLYQNGSYLWTMNPRARFEDANRVWGIGSNGIVEDYGSSGSLDVFPTLYLKSNVKILNDGSNGSIKKPYQLEL